MPEPSDLITGRPLPQREDEPVRQAAERLLLDLGYDPGQVRVEASRELAWGEGTLLVRADLLVLVREAPALLLRCARGSLVSREREAVAAARLIDPLCPPLAAVYNGDEAELLEVAGGRVLASGPGAIPGPAELERLAREHPRPATGPRQITQAARVYQAYSFISCPGQCTV